MQLKSDTRDRLVTAAMELFHRHGYGATGIAQILEFADAKSGSLYYFFPTKEDLLIAVLEKYKLMLWPALLEPIFSRIIDPIERVFGLLDGYRQMLIQTQFAYGCPIGNLALEMAHSHPNVRKLVADNFLGWREAVQKCFDEAADRLPVEIDRAQLASLVLTTMEGAIMQAKAFQSLEPFDAAVTQLRDYVERLIADGTSWSAARPSTSARSN